MLLNQDLYKLEVLCKPSKNNSCCDAEISIYIIIYLNNVELKMIQEMMYKYLEIKNSVLN